MQAGNIAVLVLVVIVLAVAYKRWRGETFTIEHTVPVRSKLDGMMYRVHPNHADASKAADRLASTNKRLIQLLRHLKKKYGASGDSQLKAANPERTAAVQALLTRFNPDNIAENSPFDPSGDTSYVLDKGALMALCLRERPKGNLKGRTKMLDDSVTMFVAVHELTHIAIDDVNHPARFWRAFKAMLEEANEIDLVPDTDFAKNPVDYCGLHVNYNPYYDATVRAIQ